MAALPASTSPKDGGGPEVSLSNVSDDLLMQEVRRREIGDENEVRCPRGTAIHTWSGLWVDLSDPQPDQICKEDLARGASNVCRYASQTHFYSVAQHQVLMARVVPESLKRRAFLHDAAESYMCDMPAPFKELLPRYRGYEHTLQRVIAEKYGVKPGRGPFIKKADFRMYHTELQSGLGSKAPIDTTGLSPVYDELLPIRPWWPTEAYERYLACFDDLF